MLLTSLNNAFHGKKLLADIGAGTGLAIINDSNVLVLNIIVVVGRLVLHYLTESRDRKRKEVEERQRQLKNDSDSKF
jgi:hypothetical protein